MGKNSPRVIRIIGQLDSDNFSIFCEELAQLESESTTKHITIELCSEGGDTYVALGYYAKIRMSPCFIDIYAFGQVMSAATVVLAAGDKRKMHVDTWFMIHDESQRVRADNTKIARSEAEHKDELEMHWSEIMARHSKMSPSYWRQQSENTTYLTAPQCLNTGIVDLLVEDDD